MMRKIKIISFVLLFSFAFTKCAKDPSKYQALQQIKHNAKQNFLSDLKKFNQYPGRPKSEGVVDSANVAAFLKDRVPMFLSSEKEFTQTYNYRWWMIAKHLKKWHSEQENKDYWVFTEFFGWPMHGSRSGAIPCPAGHQFYDLRWMKDTQYFRSYAEFYMGGFASKNNQRENRAFHSYISRPESHHYSSWMVQAMEAFLKVHPNNQWRDTMLPHMEEHQKVWDELFTVKKKGAKTDGMYKILDLYDGNEFTIGATLGLIASKGAYASYTENDWKKFWSAINGTRASELVKKYPKAFDDGYPQLYLVRPTMAGYMYGNLKTLSNLYALKAQQTKSDFDKKKYEEYAKKAKAAQQKTLEVLWDDKDSFFYSYTAADNVAGVKDWLARVRESVGYTPWYFEMVPKDERKYDLAWQPFYSKEGFLNNKGMTTAERKNPYYNEKAYAWNGRGWPFQNSVVFKAFANYLRNYKEKIQEKDRELLYFYIDALVKLHGKQKNIGEWYLPTDGKAFGGVKDYFHSSFPDMIIADLLGFKASHKNVFSLQPLLPAEKWDYFYLGDLKYHGRTIDIVWKKDWDAKKSGDQSALRLWVDGKLVKTSKALHKKIVIKLDTAV